MAALADLRVSQRRYQDAGTILQEATDQLEGLLTSTSSPWVRSRVIGGMDDVFAARLRLEAASQANPSHAFAVVEETRGRSLLELLLSKPVASVPKTPDVRARERELSTLQVKLLRTTNHAERQRLLDAIFVSEGHLAAASTELFSRTETAARKPLSLSDVQHVLRPDEVFVEFALSDPVSYCIVVTRASSRIQHLAAKTAIEHQVGLLLKSVRQRETPTAEARRTGALLLDSLPELTRARRLVISPDGDLHQLPFELLVDTAGRSLFQTHVVSYTPSGSVLVILRQRAMSTVPPRTVLAVAASPQTKATTDGHETSPAIRSPHGIYDLDLGTLPSLPSAIDEARATSALLGGQTSTVLVGSEATESAVKSQPLQDFDVLHFAVHGVLSTKVPSRSALLLLPGGTDDGLLQAGEILELRLRARLVTLSACDTGAGTMHGQDGVSSLVRPFLAAGASTVVANLWTADDQFSLALMREFYARLAKGVDIGEALRDAKLAMLERFGPEAAPALWSGVLVYGDGANAVISTRKGPGIRQ